MLKECDKEWVNSPNLRVIAAFHFYKKEKQMATARKKKALTQDDILTAYMDFAQMEDQSRYNIYKFCKHLKIDETAFYDHFANLHQIERGVWTALLDNAITTVKSDDQYDQMSAHDRLLALLFTTFENFTLNRSFLLQSLESKAGLIEKRELLAPMKKAFAAFIAENFSNMWSDNLIKGDTVTKVRRKATIDGFWTQLVLLIEYWRKDESKGFEKTDIAIEKSVKAIRDVMDVTPVKSVLDLGKFLFKDKFSHLMNMMDENSKEHTH